MNEHTDVSYEKHTELKHPLFTVSFTKSQITRRLSERIIPYFRTEEITFRESWKLQFPIVDGIYEFASIIKLSTSLVAHAANDYAVATAITMVSNCVSKVAKLAPWRDPKRGVARRSLPSDSHATTWFLSSPFLLLLLLRFLIDVTDEDSSLERGIRTEETKDEPLFSFSRPLSPLLHLFLPLSCVPPTVPPPLFENARDASRHVARRSVAQLVRLTRYSNWMQLVASPSRDYVRTRLLHRGGTRSRLEISSHFWSRTRASEDVEDRSVRIEEFMTRCSGTCPDTYTGYLN